MNASCVVSGRSRSPSTAFYPVSRKFLGIVGQDPSDSKSSWFHVDILWVFFVGLFEV